MPPSHPASPLLPHPSVSYPSPIYPLSPICFSPFSLFLSFLSFPFLSALRSPCSSPLFHSLLFLRSHRQTFEPQHGYSTRSYGVRTEGTRTVELVAPYVPCRRRRYSLSYPYRTSSLRALRSDIELRDREPEPDRVDFRFPTEGNDPGSIGIRLPSFGAPYVR